MFRAVTEIDLRGLDRSQTASSTAGKPQGQNGTACCSTHPSVSRLLKEFFLFGFDSVARQRSVECWDLPAGVFINAHSMPCCWRWPHQNIGVMNRCYLYDVMPAWWLFGWCELSDSVWPSSGTNEIHSEDTGLLLLLLLLLLFCFISIVYFCLSSCPKVLPLASVYARLLSCRWKLLHSENSQVYKQVLSMNRWLPSLIFWLMVAQNTGDLFMSQVHRFVSHEEQFPSLEDIPQNWKYAA